MWNMDDLTQRFLGAFADVEQILRRLCKARSDTPFMQLLKEGATRSRAVRSYRDDLGEHSELRNAIVHHYSNEPIAKPYAKAVKRIELTRDILVAPPGVEQAASKPVETCGPEDMIGTAATKMHGKGISQLPVYRNSRFHGLLTAETIANWLAQRLASGIGLLEEQPVKTVLKCKGEHRDCMFLNRRATAFDALHLFEQSQAAGHRLDAIILTHNGRKNESPVGIVTIFDVHKLHALVA
jgi:CBS domain-containing protein